MKISIATSLLAMASIGLGSIGLIAENHEPCFRTEGQGCKDHGNIELMEKAQIGPENNYGEFYYDLGTRFAPVKKSTLSKSSGVGDFLDSNVMAIIESYQSVSIIKVTDDEQKAEQRNGRAADFTVDQISFLWSFNYDDHFVLQVNFQARSLTSGKLFTDDRSTYLTVVPERMAYYELGKQAMIDYLGTNNRENTSNLDEERLQPAKLFFKVTRDGKLRDLRLDKSSGYPEIDAKVTKLLKNAPGRWIPAQNTAGEKVDQELAISFGLFGC